MAADDTNPASTLSDVDLRIHAANLVVAYRRDVLRFDDQPGVRIAPSIIADADPLADWLRTGQVPEPTPAVQQLARLAAYLAERCADEAGRGGLKGESSVDLAIRLLDASRAATTP